MTELFGQQAWSHVETQTVQLQEILDVLELLKEQDPSVTYRRSCREGVCGSDGVNMNGKNGLACITPLSDVVRGKKLTIKPLPGLPVIRDLIVDMEQFYNNYEKINPYF